MRNDKKKPAYDAKELFLGGLMAFWRSAVFAGYERPHYTRLQDLKRRKSHAKFRAQRVARRQQRQAA